MRNIEKGFDQVKVITGLHLKKRGQTPLGQTEIIPQVDLFNRSLRQIKIVKLNRKKQVSESIIESKSGTIVLKDNTATRNGKEDKSLTKLLERVDRAASVIGNVRKSGCKCGYEARKNPNAYGCRSRFCVKKRDDANLNNVRFINAAIRRGSQRVSYSSRMLEAQSKSQDTSKKINTKAA